MRADPQFSRDIGLPLPRIPTIRTCRCSSGLVLWRAGDYQGAEQHYRELLARHGADPDVRAALAQVLHETGRLKEAEVEAAEAAIAAPQDGRVIETLVNILLARARPDEAMRFIRAQRSRAPNGSGVDRARGHRGSADGPAAVPRAL